MKKILLICFSVMLLVGCNNDQTSSENELKDLQNEINSLTVELEVAGEKEKQFLVDIAEMDTALEDYKAEAMTNEKFDEVINGLKEKIETLEAGMIETTPTLLETAFEVMALIEAEDFMALSNYVDSSMGLRFSPYSYIDLGVDLMFTPGQVALLPTDATLYTWGTYDGIGSPINETFMDYYNEFIYDHDFITPHVIGYNTPVGFGNTLNNVTTAYPTASFIEFHFTGFNPIYEGMDWSSLKLIFENIGGEWKLININHDQWTI